MEEFDHRRFSNRSNERGVTFLLLEIVVSGVDIDPEMTRSVMQVLFSQSPS